MEFDEYQEEIKKFDLFEETANVLEPAFMAKILGLPGEAGEVSEKFKKIVRDKGGVISDEDRIGIVRELGDVTWYIATIARYMGVPFSEVAKGNIEKLTDRMERGKLHGKGDDR